jgi:hypothetical protein
VGNGEAEFDDTPLGTDDGEAGLPRGIRGEPYRSNVACDSTNDDCPSGVAEGCLDSLTVGVGERKEGAEVTVWLTKE